MQEHVTEQVRHTFQCHKLHKVASAAYRKMLNDEGGGNERLFDLTGYLLRRGFTTITLGTQVRGKIAAGRSMYPDQIIFDLVGMSEHIGKFATAVHRGAAYVLYLLDTDAARELADQEYADGLANDSEEPAHRDNT